MHPVDQQWATGHETSRTACQVCHGTDYRGTVLSWAQADRTFNALGAQHFWPGFQIGCYTCHGGPNNSDGNPNTAPTVTSLSSIAISETPLTLTLQGSDANGNALTFRAATQPGHGTVSLNGNQATYFPEAGFVGTDSFTYAAWDGSTDSKLGAVSLTVNPGQCALAVSTLAPTAAFPNSPVSFRALATLSQCSGSISYDWDFGDGTSHTSGTNVAHNYSLAADYTWTLTVRSSGVTNTVNGVVTISPTLGPPLTISLIPLGFMVEVSWPVDRIPTSLETSIDLSQPYSWQLDVDPVSSDGINYTADIFIFSDQQFFRLRRVP